VAVIVLVIVMQDAEIGGVRLLFDDDHHIVEQLGEALRERVERLFDEALELGGIDCHYQPATMLKPVTQPCVGRWNGFAA
jgi:aspartate/methionine/tyrosine aminotransferase